MVLSTDNLVWGQNFKSLFGEDFVEILGNFLVQSWYNLIQIFNNSNVSSEPGIDRTHLESDNTTADDDQIFWNFW